MFEKHLLKILKYNYKSYVKKIKDEKSSYNNKFDLLTFMRGKTKN